MPELPDMHGVLHHSKKDAKQRAFPSFSGCQTEKIGYPSRDGRTSELTITCTKPFDDFRFGAYADRARLRQMACRAHGMKPAAGDWTNLSGCQRIPYLQDLCKGPRVKSLKRPRNACGVPSGYAALSGGQCKWPPHQPGRPERILNLYWSQAAAGFGYWRRFLATALTARVCRGNGGGGLLVQNSEI